MKSGPDCWVCICECLFEKQKCATNNRNSQQQHRRKKEATYNILEISNPINELQEFS